MKKTIYIIGGLVCTALGALGVVLPILPTTPFLLLAAWLFARSSEKLDTWFRNTKLYKNNLETLSKGQGMTIKAKLRIVGSVTLIMLIAFICMHRVPVGRICLAVVWIAHVIVFGFVIKTCPEDEMEGDEAKNDV